MNECCSTMNVVLFDGKTLVVIGSSYIRTCLEKSIVERYENFMSIDWLPHEETRRFPDHVYTEPCWTRTVKGHLWDRREDLNHLYQIFDLFKENSRILAEGNFSLLEISVSFHYPSFAESGRIREKLPSAQIKLLFAIEFIAICQNFHTECSIHLIFIFSDWSNPWMSHQIFSLTSEMVDTLFGGFHCSTMPIYSVLIAKKNLIWSVTAKLRMVKLKLNLRRTESIFYVGMPI